MERTGGENYSAILVASGIHYPLCPPMGNATDNSSLKLAYSTAVLITSTLGICGNVLSGTVLNLPSMRSSYSLLLTCLTVSDTLQLIQFWLFVGSHALNQAGLSISIHAEYPELAIVMSVVGWIAFTASTYFTVLVSFERYIAICKPFQSLRLFPSKKRTCGYITLVILFSVLFNLPKWWELEPCVEVLSVNNELRSKCEDGGLGCDLDQDAALNLRRRIMYTWIMGDQTYAVVYVNWANIIINFLLPLATLLVLNICIYRGMRQATKRQRMIIPAGQQAPDNSITSMLIIVVAVFCACQIWYPLARLINIWCRSCERPLGRFYTYLYCLNSSINFLIYCVWGKKFRRQLVQLCQSMFCGAEFPLGRTNHCSQSTIRSTGVIVTGL